MGKKGRRRRKKKRTSVTDSLPFYDHENAESYSTEELENLVQKIPPLLKSLQADIMASTSELRLLREEEAPDVDQLQVSDRLINLYYDQQQLFMMMGHITVDQCKRYKEIAVEKERALEEHLNKHRVGPAHKAQLG